MKRRQFRHDLKAGIFSQKPGIDFLRRTLSLPGHGGAKLENTHQLFRQRQVPAKENANSRFTCSGQDFEDFARDLLGIFDLTQNSNLHVVNKQRGPARVAHVLESLRDVQSESRLHRVE